MKLALSNNRIELVQEKTNTRVERIKPAVYVFNQTGQHDWALLRQEDKFTLPNPLYDPLPGQAKIFFSTYRDRALRQLATGVLAYGIKGNGKTTMLRKLANMAINAGLPVFIVSSLVPAKVIMRFLDHGPAAVLFDEFEKTYGREGYDPNKNRQDEILSMVDDTRYPGTLWLMGANGGLNENFVNRPGRFLFALDAAKGMDPSTVKHVLDAQGAPDWLYPTAKYTVSANPAFSIDALSTAVEAAKSSKDLNDFKKKIKHFNIPQFKRRGVLRLDVSKVTDVSQDAKGIVIAEDFSEISAFLRSLPPEKRYAFVQPGKVTWCGESFTFSQYPEELNELKTTFKWDVAIEHEEKALIVQFSAIFHDQFHRPDAPDSYEMSIKPQTPPAGEDHDNKPSDGVFSDSPSIIHSFAGEGVE